MPPRKNPVIVLDRDSDSDSDSDDDVVRPSQTTRRTPARSLKFVESPTGSAEGGELPPVSPDEPRRGRQGTAEVTPESNSSTSAASENSTQAARQETSTRRDRHSGPRSRSRVRMASSVDRAQAEKAKEVTHEKKAMEVTNEKPDGETGADKVVTETNFEHHGTLGTNGEPKKNERDSTPSPPTGRASPDKPPKKKYHVLMQRAVNAPLFAWIWPKLKDFEAMKPVIRCAVAAWIGLLMLLIYPALATLGQAAFFVLIVAFICPPSLPFVQAMEQIFFLFLFVGLSWAWVCLGAFFASLARTDEVNSALLQQNENKFAGLRATNPEAYARKIIFEGTYIQAGPSIICAAFLGIGTGFFAWLKMHTAPNPFTFALVLACVLADVSLTLIQLFPYDYYTSGLLFMLPMSVQCSIAIICSLLIFPQTVSDSFSSKLGAILHPLRKSCEEIEGFLQDVALIRTRYHSSDKAGVLDTPEQHDLFRVTTMTDEQKLETLQNWAGKGLVVRGHIIDSAAGLGPCKAQAGYLTKELCYSRYSGEDLKGIFTGIQTLQLRAGGVSFFFDVINNAIKHSHLDSSAFSVHTAKGPESRLPTPAPSRPVSLYGDEPNHDHSHDLTPTGSLNPNNGPHSGHTSPLSSPLHLDASSLADRLSREDTGTRNRYSAHHGFALSKRLAFPSQSSRSLHHGHPSILDLKLHRNISQGDRNSSHTSLMDHLRKIQAPVGVYESAKYMNVEKEQDGDADHIIQQLDLLAFSASPLVQQMTISFKGAISWLDQIKKERNVVRNMLRLGFSQEAINQSSLKHSKMVQDLENALENFKKVDRLIVLQPYRHLLDPKHPPSEEVNYRTLKHRALFWDFLFSYHVIEYSTALLALLKTMQKLEADRQEKKLWWPKLSITWGYFRKPEHNDENDDIHDDDDPDRAIPDEDNIALGRAKRRDPDNQPFQTPLLNALGYIDKALGFLSNREFLFAVKAGVLTILVALPAYFPTSAGFFYYNRGLWVIIMAQLTLSLYSGETASAWLARIQGSFFGCITGMVLWYIGAGNGKGNAYGIAAVCAVVFPVVMMIRLYYPGPPLAPILFSVSTALVVGYSWLNAHLVQATNATWGWDVAWRRFVCVVIGITSAFIFALLPPATSGKVQLRLSYSRAVKNIGNLFCDILSEACDPSSLPSPTHDQTREGVLAMKRKLVKLGSRHAAISFEFSFKGVWPANRYKALQDVCVDLVSLLSQMHHVTKTMPYGWRRSLLVRSRLMDPQFVGDVLAVISMCSSSLRAGIPLPQITPGPLVERLYQRKYGLTVAQLEGDSDPTIPREVTVDVLESEEYLQYALATTTVFSIIRRFDKMLMIVKTIVGEDFHLDNLDLMEKYA